MTFLEAVIESPAHLVGCSDGATVALLVALRRPELVRSLVFVAAVFHHRGWAPAVIDPPEFMADSYGEGRLTGATTLRSSQPSSSKYIGGAHALDRGARERFEAHPGDGDDDEVTLEHAVAMYRAIPDAELAVVTGTSHGLLVEKHELCNGLIVEFLISDPVPTLAPIRRAK
jgi:pimeloyl-ACP methyl ester carboxylesterase